jgi:hypothetical protein
MIPYPLEPPIPDMDVAGQHKISELNMEITQDILLVITARKNMIR